MKRNDHIGREYIHNGTKYIIMWASSLGGHSTKKDGVIVVAAENKRYYRLFEYICDFTALNLVNNKDLNNLALEVMAPKGVDQHSFWEDELIINEYFEKIDSELF